MKKAFLFLSLLLAFSAPACATFAYKIAAVVDPTQVVSNASNFAVEFKGTDNTLKQAGSGGQMQNALAYDARAFSDSACTTALDFELDSYDASAPQLIMWVRIPTLSGSVPTNYWICFGDASLNTNASSTSTWDSSVVAKYHMRDGTTLSAVDSTVNALNLTNHSAAAIAGVIDGAASIPNSGYMEQLSTSGLQFNYNSTFRISFWGNITSSSQQALIGNLNPSSGYQGWEISKVSSVGDRLELFLISSYPTAAIYVRSAGITLDAFQKFEVKYDGTGLASGVTFLANGSPLSSLTIVDTLGTGTTTNSQTTFVGKRRDSTDQANASLDELGIDSIMRTNDWSTAEYNNQSNPTAGGFYTSITYSANGGGGGGGTSRATTTGVGH